MNGVIYADECYAYHKVMNVEFSGILIDDYHFFIKYGDKVYMEVKGVGEIVISFAELQKHKYWKQYYDLSRMLTKDKHTLAQDIVYSSKDAKYSKDIYKDERFWSINTAFKDKETNKIIDYGYVCYYRINPYELQYMEYSSPEDFEVFQEAYAMTRSKLIESELASCKEFAKELQAMRQENM